MTGGSAHAVSALLLFVVLFLGSFLELWVYGNIACRILYLNDGWPDTMSDLKALIKGLRQENFHHRKFVPELSLCRAMTKDVVCKALEDSGRYFHSVSLPCQSLSEL